MSPPVYFNRLDFKRLSEECPRDVFSCGFSILDNWFSQRAWLDHTSLYTRVITAHIDGGPEPIGYYGMTLEAEHENLFAGSGLILRYNYIFSNRHMMVCRVKNFAVDKNWQRMNVGTLMLGHAIDSFYEVVKRTGAYALTLQSIDDDKKSFYSRLGFENYGSPSDRKMILPARSVMEIRGEAE